MGRCETGQRWFYIALTLLQLVLFYYKLCEIVLYSLQVFRSSSLVLLAIVTFFYSWKVERQKRRLVSHGLLDFLMMIQC